MKTNKNIIFTAIGKFYRNNKTVIDSAVMYGVVLYLGKRFGLKLPGFNGMPQLETDEERQRKEEWKKDFVNNPDILPAATTSIEEAIVTMWRTGNSASFDSARQRSANDIANLILGLDSVSDGTLQYAIAAIQKIGQKASFDSARSAINNTVTRLIKNAKVKKEEEKSND